eukprot:g11108.t2
MLYEALLARAADDGQNLLMYAVRWGRENWFLHLVHCIQEQLGFDVLVKQLRACDINGTPLLCLAASSRSITTCFQTVYDKLHAVLGTVGVVEQVRQKDHMGRNILMHAARGNHLDVFKRVQDLYEGHQYTFASPSAGVDDTTLFIEEDITGRKVLHHAAEAGCLEVLSEIINLSKLTGIMSYMDWPDHNGLTPMHHLLRAKYGEPEGRDELSSKFNILWCVSGSWMKPREVMGWTPTARQDRVEVIAQTELIHAARGGLSTLQLVLDKIHTPTKVNDVRLDEVLSVNVAEMTDSSPSDEELAAWGWGMLLAAATKGGNLEVLEIVVRAIKTGILRFGQEDDTNTCKEDDMNDRPAEEGAKRVDKACSAIQSSGSSWFRLAVLSGNVEAVLWVYRYLAQHSEGQVWDHVCGELTKTSHIHAVKAGRAADISPLTCASSLPMNSRHHGVDVWIAVYECLREAAKSNFGEAEVEKEVSEQFTSRWMSGGQFTGRWMPGTPEPSSTPLTSAAFTSNWVLFETIYDKFESLRRKKWSRAEMLVQLRIASSGGRILGEHQAMHEHTKHVHACVGRGAANIRAVMWRDLVEAYERADDEVVEEQELWAWRETLKSLSGKALQSASETGVFDDLRELVKEGFPIHDDFIPFLLNSAEDEDVADIVMFAVANTSNPLVTAASVSKYLRNAETDRPMHRTRLRYLQQIIDDLTSELLNKLPHTVRGMGMALLRPVVPQHRLPGLQRQRRDTLALLAGYMVVEWILEPRLLNLQTTTGARYNGPIYVDPLQRALDRGSKALDFYQLTAHHGLRSRQIYVQLSSSGQQSEALNQEPWDDRLLRFLQGWDVEDMMDELERTHKRGNNDGSTKPRTAWGRRWAQLPHSTALPMLQFSLAGIIGKPDTFYNVPAVRFAFEFLQFLTMLVLFCFSVRLQDRNSIADTEIMFYLYMAGTLWREVQEFCEGIPARHRQHRRPLTLRTDTRNNSDSSRASLWISSQSNKAGRPPRRRGLTRLASTFTRYFFYDTWNLVDIFTIVTVFLSFVFRLLGMSAGEEHFFAAQFFLAVSAPLLFARLLLLTQIDDTLGPMTQIIWRMMSQTLRFGVFIVIVMAGFALAFHAVFFSCDADSDLGRNFRTFSAALLYVFEAPLGEFDFEEFDDVRMQCPSQSARQQMASDAGIFLLVAYLLILAIVMLNLLVAVLTTAHGEVYSNGNGEKEFHLARTRLIQQTARAVAYGFLPPPFNLVQLVSGFVADGVNELWYRFVKITGWYPIVFKPVTTMCWWRTFDGMMQRFAFAYTMGLAAVVLNAILWMLSMPLIVWKIVRWTFRKVALSRLASSGQKGKSEHFHVAPLLHSTTGSDMERLCLLTKKKRDNQQQKQQQHHQEQQAAADSEESKTETVGDTQEAAGGYIFPVQKQNSRRFSKDIVRGIENSIKSFLLTAKETEVKSIPVPSFEGEGCTDRDGTAVFLGGIEASDGIQFLLLRDLRFYLNDREGFTAVFVRQALGLKLEDSCCILTELGTLWTTKRLGDQLSQRQH